MKLYSRIFLASLTTIMSLAAMAQGTFFLHHDNACPAEAVAMISLHRAGGGVSTLVGKHSGSGQTDTLLCQPGDYSILTIIKTRRHGADSLRRFFTIGDSEKVYCNVNLSRRKNDLRCDIRIDRFHDEKEDSVDIRFVKYLNGGGEFPGPLFMIRNRSTDTLYGEWLPGCFWGEVARAGDDVYRSGQICTTWNDEPPLRPDSAAYSWVGSFGKKLKPGKYRYRVRYSKTPGAEHFKQLVRKRKFCLTWHASSREFFNLYCDFEVKER